MNDAAGSSSDHLTPFLEAAIRETELLAFQAGTLVSLIPTDVQLTPKTDQQLTAAKELLSCYSQVSSILQDVRQRLKGQTGPGFFKVPIFRPTQLLPEYIDPFPAALFLPDNSKTVLRPTGSELNEKGVSTKREAVEKQPDNEISPNEATCDPWNGREEAGRNPGMTSDTANSNQPDEFRRFGSDARTPMPFTKVALSDTKKEHMDECFGTLHADTPWQPTLGIASPINPSRPRNVSVFDLNLSMLANQIANVAAGKRPFDFTYLPRVTEATQSAPLPSAVGKALYPLATDSSKLPPPWKKERKSANPAAAQKRIAKRRKGAYQILPMEVKEKTAKICQMYSLLKTEADLTPPSETPGQDASVLQEGGPESHLANHTPSRVVLDGHVSPKVEVKEEEGRPAERHASGDEKEAKKEFGAKEEPL